MRSRYSADPNRLFKAAPTPSAIPPRFSITDSQSFLHSLAQASAQHRVSRTDTGAVLDSTVEGGSYFSITPAGSQQELDDQLALLTRAFVEHEGHEPSERDDAYWVAVNEIMDAYDGPEIGDPEVIMGGLS
jgi:hypothetical protein